MNQNRKGVNPRLGKLLLASLLISIVSPIQPASALEATATEIDGVAATETSSSPYIVGSSVTFSVAVDFNNAYDDDDDTTIKAKLTTGTGGSITATAAGATFTNSGDTCGLSASGATISVSCDASNGDAFDGVNASTIGTYTFVPTTVGSHILTFWHDANGNGNPDGPENKIDKSFTVLAVNVEVSTASVLSFSLATSSTSVQVGDLVTVNWGADTSSFVVSASEEGQFTVEGDLTTDPGVTTTVASDVAAGTDSIPTGSNGISETASGSTYVAKSSAAGEDLLGNDVTATSSDGFGKFTFTPTVGGTYVLTVWHDFDRDQVKDMGETSQTISIIASQEATATEIDGVAATETSSSPYIVGSSVTFSVAVDFNNAYDDDDDTTIKAKLTTGTGGSITATAAGATFTNSGDTCGLSASGATISVSCDASNGDAFDGVNASTIGTYTFVPTTVGSHILTFWHDANGNGNPDGPENKIDKSFTVSAATAVPTSAINSLSLKLSSATNNIKNQVEINWGANTNLAVFNPGELGQLRIAGVLTGYPSGGFVQSLATTTSFGVGAVNYVLDNTSESVSGAIYFATATTDGEDILGNTVAATSTSGFGGFSFTPAVAGDYTLTVWHDADLDGVIDTLETRQTITVTVSAQSVYSQTLSTVFTQDGAGVTAATAASSLVPIHGPKAIANAQLGSATINLKDALGADITTADAITISAYVTGVGFVTANETHLVPVATGCSGPVTTRTVSWVANGVDTLYICADGTAGSGSVVISTTSAAGITTALKTINYSTFGDVAKLAIDAQYVNVLKSGGAVQGVDTDVQPVTYATHPVLVIAATDANGNLVEDLNVGTVSSDLTKISAATALEGTNWFGPGYYLSAITTAATSVSGDTASVTYRVLDPATGFTTYLTAVANFTFGGSPATVTLATDKAVYEPGALGTLTVTAKDSSGNPVADVDYANFFTAAGVSSTVATVAAGLPAAAVNVMAKGVKTYTFYAPGTVGDFTLAGTLGTSAASASRGKVVSVTAKVDSSVMNAATDAALEAIDAANAATDAANLAAEAADAATVAAEEARDAADAATAAVEALATEIAALIAKLQAQLTTLANTVAKIAKKVKVKKVKA